MLGPLSTNSRTANATLHPIIANAYQTVIRLAHSQINDLPPLDTFVYSIQALRKLSQNVDKSPSTPIRSNNDMALIPFRAEASPRTKIAEEKAHSLAGKLGSAWSQLVARCADIQFHMQSNREDLLDGDIAFFLMMLELERKTFEPFFDNLRHLHQPQIEKAKGAIAAAITHIQHQTSPMSPEVFLCYLLESLPPPPPPDSSRTKPDVQEAGLRWHLAQSLRQPYKGNAERRFVAFTANVNLSLFINRPHDNRPYYKGTHIIQSSGTGKTRMLLQVGQTAPLLYVCIRPLEATSVRAGYPLGDKPIMQLALKDLLKNMALSYDHRAAILLAAWFATLAQHLQTLDLPAAKFGFLLRLNDFGNQEHEEMRLAFFDAVARNALHLSLRPRLGGVGNDSIFSSYLDGPLQSLRHQISLMELRHPRQSRTASDSPSDTLVYVAIDECTTLPSHFLDSICRAWNYIGEFEHQLREQALHLAATQGVRQKTSISFWLVLMSTQSGSTALVRPQAEYTSMRHRDAVPLPTFVGVGFDVLKDEVPPLATANQAADPSHMQKYGRPLWSSLLQSEFWTTAIQKLLGTAKFVRGKRKTCFNILASRLALQFVPTRTSDTASFGRQATFARDAVDRHMRILKAVDIDAVMHIDSPSEPVLATAAALIMMPSPSQTVGETPVFQQKVPNRYGSILETLSTMCLASADVDILKGIRGELMTRLLFLTAWDALKSQKAEFKISEDQHRRARCHSEPEPLEAILRGIVELDSDSKKRVQEHIQGVCQKVRERQSSHTNVNVWTRFTHFDHLKVTVSEISPEYLWYCWKRGVAIQMPHIQYGIDGIIPVFVGDLSQPLGDAEEHAAAQMTFVAWEAKNRAKAGPAEADSDARKDIHAGPKLRHEQGSSPALLTERGLLTVLIDLNIKDQQVRVKDINTTGSLQVWVRGLGGSNNYPCLDTLGIRDAAVVMHRVVRNHAGEDVYNRIPDPMDLDRGATIFDADPMELDHAAAKGHEADDNEARDNPMED